ncbi:MAG: MotA/TolQ/ExbB proton channel family protein [Candidatus Hydrogenedentes bacterium]|nr:MotA/TolQ/ExbB proton channel family protein [Candidatus Hydrogenedentota bacterium]
MDIATLLGLGGGAAIILVVILLGGNPAIFLNPQAAVIVLGGTMATTLIHFPLRDVLGVFGTIKHCFLEPETEPEETIERLVSFAVIARREGILSLEAHVGETGDVFMQRSLQLAIDGASPELIKDILTTELAFTESRHAVGQSILACMAAFAPAYGLIGTLVGLVLMLITLKDPAMIGRGMAVALLTTLYGVVVANLIFLPLNGKLKIRSSRELLIKEIIVEGILSIQSGDNPRVVEQKLIAFVPPAVRERIAFRR